MQLCCCCRSAAAFQAWHQLVRQSISLHQMSSSLAVQLQQRSMQHCLQAWQAHSLQKQAHRRLLERLFKVKAQSRLSGTFQAWRGYVANFRYSPYQTAYTAAPSTMHTEQTMPSLTHGRKVSWSHTHESRSAAEWGVHVSMSLRVCLCVSVYVCVCAHKLKCSRDLCSFRHNRYTTGALGPVPSHRLI